MNTYECLVKTGHRGSGKYGEQVRRVRAYSIFEAMKIAKRLPGVKKGGLNFSGASVLRISLVHS